MNTAGNKSSEKICPKCDGKMISIWTSVGCFIEIGHECGECGYKEMIDMTKGIVIDAKSACPMCKTGKLTKKYLPPNDGWPNGRGFVPGGALTGSQWIYRCDKCDHEEKILNPQ